MTHSVDEILELLDPVTPEDVRAMSDAGLRARIEFQMKNFPCFALPSPDAPAVVCGITHDLGVGECWMITGRRFSAQGPLKDVLRSIRRGLPHLVQDLQLRRLHMLIDPARAGTVRFAEKTGFAFEARLQRLGVQGQDLDMYIYRGDQS